MSLDRLRIRVVGTSDIQFVSNLKYLINNVSTNRRFYRKPAQWNMQRTDVRLICLLDVNSLFNHANLLALWILYGAFSQLGVLGQTTNWYQNYTSSGNIRSEIGNKGLLRDTNHEERRDAGSRHQPLSWLARCYDWHTVDDSLKYHCSSCSQTTYSEFSNNWLIIVTFCIWPVHLNLIKVWSSLSLLWMICVLSACGRPRWIVSKTLLVDRRQNRVPLWRTPFRRRRSAEWIDKEIFGRNGIRPKLGAGTAYAFEKGYDRCYFLQ